ncbi:MAG: LysR family transcriptional regulator [Sporolactobacillus sp.]
MPYDALQTFVTLADIGNFTRTAEYLHISQSGVSLHIQTLETEFGTPLFVRSSRAVAITPSGRILYHRAKQLLALYEQTRQEILAQHNLVKGELRIGASLTIGEYLLPGLIADLQQSYPALELTVTVANTERIVTSVRELQSDVGLIEGQTDDHELIIQPFMNDELFITAPTRHPLAQRTSVRIAELQNQTWLIREEGSGTRQYLEHILRANGLKTKAMMTINSSQGIKEALIQGVDGLTLLSGHIIRTDLTDGRLATIPIIGQTFRRTFSIVHLPMMAQQRSVSAFLETLHNKWKRGGDAPS